MVNTAYIALVLAVAFQRVLEVRVSRRNEAALRSRGGLEHARGQMPVMIALHTSWLIACVLEGTLRHASPPNALVVLALIVFGAGQALRLSAMRTLGERWTVKIITVPGEPPVTSGIFRYVRHPNYLGVILEIFSLPLVGGAWFTAMTFSIFNAVLLWARIRAEERALVGSGAYDEHFRDRPRFVPRLVHPRSGNPT